MLWPGAEAIEMQPHLWLCGNLYMRVLIVHKMAFAFNPILTGNLTEDFCTGGRGQKWPPSNSKTKSYGNTIICMLVGVHQNSLEKRRFRIAL